MFHLHSINLGLKSMGTLQKQVEIFLTRDDNSVVVADVKKAVKGIWYRFLFLKKLYERFTVDKSAECSYSQFTGYISEKILMSKSKN